MSDLDAKRDEISREIARQRGLGPDDSAEIDRRTRDAIGRDPTGSGSSPRLHRLVTEYRDLAALRADTANARLAEEGEVFAPEDDA